MSLFNNKKLSKVDRQSMRILKETRNNLLHKTKDFYILEAYKALRTNINFSLTKDVEGGYVIAVTSSLPSEGKSFNSVNIAISYAQTYKKVLLIDCDLRRPNVSRLLNIKPNIGLSNVLVSPNLISEAVVETEIENIDVITAGDIPPNPSELLGSSRMEYVLKWAREKYDLVVLDTPPINMVTDTAVLSKLTDGILFVVRSGQRERKEVIQAVEQLKYVQAKILGFILNDISSDKGTYTYKRHGKYGYGKYGYGYGYGQYVSTEQDDKK